MNASLFMRKRTFLLFSLSVTMLQSFAQTTPPNIIYIMSDDMGYSDLSGYGRKEYSTPNLDKLALQGIKFINAYAAAPLCTPTRAAFMTGRYPARTLVGRTEPLTSTPRDTAIGLTPDYPTIASLLRESGYETALIGKWHLGLLPRHSPTKNGYDYFYGIRTGAADYISHRGDGPLPDLWENDTRIDDQGYLTELFSAKAVSFVNRKRTKPFFLTLMFNSPHWPWQAPGDKPYPDTINFRTGGSPATFAAMMKSMDDAVGQLMQALDASGMAANTIVIFTNDNGGERFSDNGGLRESKATLWEGGIKVPAFIRWPGNIKPAQMTKQLAITMDWSATILAAGRAGSVNNLDGIDLMPLCTGIKTISDRTFYWKRFQGNMQHAIRDGKWKYMKDEKGEYLFDLDADPGESKDLRESQSAVFDRLRAMFKAWEKEMVD